jgi:tetratricopeptide (TPR) repeat protein
MEAIVYLNKAIELNPHDSIPHYVLGTVHAKLGEDAQAIIDFSNAISLNPNDKTPLIDRGYAYIRKKKYKLAKEDFFSFKGNKSDMASCYSGVGLIYQLSGEYGIAIAHYSESIKYDPDDANTYINRGSAYHEIAIKLSSQGEHDKESKALDLAIDDFTRAIELQPDKAAAYYNRAIVYNLQSKHELAEKDEEKYQRLTNNQI